jgi:hypothetical protein
MTFGSAAIHCADQSDFSSKPTDQSDGSDFVALPASSQTSTDQWQTSRERSGLPA